jgi:hypothetical protein
VVSDSILADAPHRLAGGREEALGASFSVRRPPCYEQTVMFLEPLLRFLQRER